LATKTGMPNKAAFKLVCEQLEQGEVLTLEHVGMVFGQPFWVMLVYCFMDSADAARAIAGAINRLREGGKEDLDEDVSDRSN